MCAPDRPPAEKIRLMSRSSSRSTPFFRISRPPLLGIFLLLLVSPLRGESPLPSLALPVESPMPREAGHRQTVAIPIARLGEARAELAKRLEQVRMSIDSFHRNTSAAPPPEGLVMERVVLKWIDSLYVQRIAANERIVQLQKEMKKLEDQVGDLPDRSVHASGLENEPSRSFLLLDDWEDQLSAQRDRARAFQFELQIAHGLVETARAKFDTSEAERRKTREAMELAGNRSTSGPLVRQYGLAQLKSHAAAEAVQKSIADVTILQLQHAIATMRSKRLQEKVVHLRQTAIFSPQDLQRKIKRVAQVETSLRQELVRVQSRLQSTNQKWNQVSQQLKNTATPDHTLVEEAKAWKLAYEVTQEKISLLNQVLQEIGLVRVCWRYRYEVFNHLVSLEVMRSWAEKAEMARTRFKKFRQLLELHVDARRGDLAQLRKELMGLDETIPDHERVRRWLDKQVTEFQQLLTAYDSQLVLIKAADRLVGRFARELQVELAPSSYRQWLATGQQWFVACWNYEITSIDDSPITVSKVIRGLILLLVGYYLARTLSRLLGRRILPRLGLNGSACTAFQTVAFYLMLACAGFVALEIIHLPLTVFAFMGGAVAIGIGFGSQNVLNNFMSGLILLAERPIRVGDLIDIDGLMGTIEHVGARSTRVRTGSNLEIIVPNSKFLENNVTNWTLSDAQIRISVQVGVAYGSSTSQVSRLLEQVLTAHDTILQYPAPIVLFKEFGDNSLNFEAHFWIHMRTEMEGQIVESEVRHAIDCQFEKAGIVIAYPQRDVHLDMSAPLEVHLRDPRRVERAIEGRSSPRAVMADAA